MGGIIHKESCTRQVYKQLGCRFSSFGCIHKSLREYGGLTLSTAIQVQHINKYMPEVQKKSVKLPIQKTFNLTFLFPIRI